MRTVIMLDDELHRRAKAYAASHGMTLAALIADALQVRLADTAASRRAPVVLPTFKGQGLAPALSLDDMKTIDERMDLGTVNPD